MTTMTKPTMTKPTMRPTPMTEPLSGPLAVRFVEPLLGFDQYADFGLVPIDAEGVLVAMRALAEPELRFVLTPANLFFPDYAPLLGAGVASALGAEEAQLRMLLVLTIPGDLAGATANLRAPIVVAASAGTAMQVVLDDPSLPMHAPILPSTAPESADLA